MTRPFFAALASLLLCAPGSAQAVDLIPHHAFYELQLGKQNDQSSIVDAHGGMGIEVSETCDAWISKQRLRLSIRREEGEEVVTDNSFTSWESKDGLRYRFSVRNRLNGEVTEEFRGDAHLKDRGGAGTATFTQPEKRNVELPKGALFPTNHVAQLLEAARKGTHIFNRIVFDGATADGPDEINAIVGKPKPLEKLPGLEKKLGQPTWPMRWAFYPIGSKEETPDYEIAVHMLDDGVVTDVNLIYEDFEVGGKIVYFEPLPVPKC
ncbi:MAG TPA: cell envelope integrity EipB family protein [Alphaproteobacteria bacterium]